MEIYSSSGSPQQARTSRKHPYILPHKKTILWERYEQGYLEIYCKLHTFLQSEGQDSELSSLNNGNPCQTF